MHDDPGRRAENLPADVWARNWNELVVPSGFEQAALAALPVKREALAEAWPDGAHLATGFQKLQGFGGGGGAQSDAASAAGEGKCWI